MVAVRGGKEMAADAIQEIYQSWMITADRAQWVGEQPSPSEPYGFDWWPGDFKVEVRAFGPHPEIEKPTYRLSVQTDFLTEVDNRAPSFFPMLSSLNPLVPTSCMISHPKEVLEDAKSRRVETDPPRVWLETTAYLDESTAAWLPPLFGGLTILQPIESQFRAALMTRALGGRPEHSKCPDAKDTGTHGLLGLEEVYADAGQGQSAWAGTGEFEEIVDKWGPSDRAVGLADATSLTLGTPFGSDQALLRMTTDQPHLRLGNGLLVLLSLPFSLDAQEAAERANWLNFWESRKFATNGVPFIGGWSARGDAEPEPPKGIRERLGRWIGRRPAPRVMHSLAFSCFIPNMLYRPRLAEHLVLHGLARARWAREMLLPGVTDLSMREILVRAGVLPASVLEDDGRPG